MEEKLYKKVAKSRKTKAWRSEHMVMNRWADFTTELARIMRRFQQVTITSD